MHIEEEAHLDLRRSSGLCLTFVGTFFTIVRVGPRNSAKRRRCCGKASKMRVRFQSGDFHFGVTLGLRIGSKSQGAFT